MLSIKVHLQVAENATANLASGRSMKIMIKRSTETQALIFYLQDLVLFVSSVPL
ncbi:MAG: hypothetical protein ACK5O7_03150 [Holosporales bacterium]